MAKYHDVGISGAAWTAATDLTTKQYYFVMPGSVAGEVVLATGASNTTPLGVLQNSPSAGQEAHVKVLGFSKVVAEIGSCNLTFGRYGFCASDGQFEVQASATGAINARWMGANLTAAGSSIGEVLLFGGFGGCTLAQL